MFSYWTKVTRSEPWYKTTNMPSSPFYMTKFKMLIWPITILVTVEEISSSNGWNISLRDKYHIKSLQFE